MRAALLKNVETLPAGGARRLLTSVDILQRATTRQRRAGRGPAVAARRRMIRNDERLPKFLLRVPVGGWSRRRLGFAPPC